MNKLILKMFAVLLLSMATVLFTSPLFCYANDESELIVLANEYINSDNHDTFDSYTRLAKNENTNIYLTMEDTEPVEIAGAGCSFEVIGETEDWSLITTSDGIAYIKTEDLIPTYSEEDLYVLAHVICGECQCYPDQEQLYVGSVVLNRVKSNRYPNTISGVVFQRGQYACTWDGNYYRTPTDRNWANAKYLLEHGSVLPDNVVYQSGARQGKGVYTKTKWHYYCY